MMQGQTARLDEVFAALADPTRRAILATLGRGEVNVGDVAARFPISLNGVSKHVRVLERAGLVLRTVHGREHRLRLDAGPLGDVADWLERYRTFWTARLDALEALLPEQKRALPPVPKTIRRGRAEMRRRRSR